MAGVECRRVDRRIAGVDGLSHQFIDLRSYLLFDGDALLSSHGLRAPEIQFAELSLVEIRQASAPLRIFFCKPGAERTCFGRRAAAPRIDQALPQGVPGIARFLLRLRACHFIVRCDVAPAHLELILALRSLSGRRGTRWRHQYSCSRWKAPWQRRQDAKKSAIGAAAGRAAKPGGSTQSPP